MKTLPTCFLLKEAESALRNGAPVKIRLVGNSMLPFLRENRDILTITPSTPEQLSRGQIVLAQTAGQYYLHRIVSTDGNRLLLCGDANRGLFENVSVSEVIGILQCVEYSGRMIRCDSLCWKIKGEVWICLYPVRRYLIAVYRIICRVKSNRQ